jgi:hypothetical protein
MLASEPLAQLEELFLSAYTEAGSPSEMAALMRHESEGRLHCEVVVYFSPAAALVARQLNAKPCPRPSPDGLSPLVGAGNSWMSLFPDR